MNAKNGVGHWVPDTIFLFVPVYSLFSVSKVLLTSFVANTTEAVFPAGTDVEYA
jgi:hypothetical protein